MNILVVHNAKSGRADQLQAIQAAFKKQGAAPTYLPITDKNLASRVKAATATRGAIVVAAGGDGTVSTVAGYVCGTNCKFGIIPTGTLNHFAKDAGLPLELTAAVRTILHGNIKKVDAGMVNKQVFINNSSIGIYPASLRTRKKIGDSVGKWPAALYGVSKVLWRPRHYHVALTIDGEHISRRSPFVFVGNNTYKRTAPAFLGRAQLDGGKLAIYVIKASSPFAIMRLFITALFTQKRRTQDFEVYYAQSCTIHTKRRRLNVAWDGEVGRLGTPLRYRIQPGGLRVIAP